MNKFAMTAATAALMLSLSAGALAASGLGSVTTMSGAGAEADKAGSVTINTTMCALELDDAGKIVSVSVPENNETPGLGADLIADQSIFDALVGQDIATAQIDVKSGVTLTSNAINDALGQAAKEVQ